MISSDSLVRGVELFRRWSLRLVMVVFIGFVGGVMCSVLYERTYATVDHAEWAAKFCLADRRPDVDLRFTPGLKKSLERVVCRNEDGEMYNHKVERQFKSGDSQVECFDTIPAKFYPPGWSCQIKKGSSLQAVDVYFYWESTEVWFR